MPVRLFAITGTHSTGKTTFLNAVEQKLTKAGRTCGRIDDLARRARDKGFPILDQHTYESTLWIMAEALRHEAELMLGHDVILVDRPLIDAYAYLLAALEYSGRTLPPADLSVLQGIARSHCRKYDIMVATKLDPSIPLGPGRDTDFGFRALADRQVHQLLEDWQIAHRLMRVSDSSALADIIVRKLCD